MWGRRETEVARTNGVIQMVAPSSGQKGRRGRRRADFGISCLTIVDPASHNVSVVSGKREKIQVLEFLTGHPFHNYNL